MKISLAYLQVGGSHERMPQEVLFHQTLWGMYGTFEILQDICRYIIRSGMQIITPRKQV